MAGIPGQGYWMYDAERKKQMLFKDLSDGDRISYTKHEFSELIKNIFENPEILKSLVNERKISNEQSKIMLDHIHKMNSKTCVCCRRFDAAKLKMAPVERELEPLLDVAQTNVKARSY
jgi:hypothetical protein